MTEETEESGKILSEVCGERFSAWTFQPRAIHHCRSGRLLKQGTRCEGDQMDTQERWLQRCIWANRIRNRDMVHTQQEKEGNMKHSHYRRLYSQKD